MFLPVPRTLPISELRYNQNQFFEWIKVEPILLTVHGVSAAVVISPEMWNELVERLRLCEEK